MSLPGWLAYWVNRRTVLSSADGSPPAATSLQAGDDRPGTGVVTIEDVGADTGEHDAVEAFRVVDGQTQQGHRSE